MTCLVPGLDGIVPQGTLPPDGCCPPSLCNIDPCSILCNFVQQLPRGPLWDRAKAEAISKIRQRNTAVGCEPFSCGTSCASVVDHAVFMGHQLIEGLFGALWPALREADPYTAYDTLDAWLERYGWRDCYDCACRDPTMTELSPVEIWGVISDDGLCEGPICCPPTFPAELQCAVKRGTVIALDRLSLSPRMNVDALNFAIAPLGARLEFVCYQDIALDPTRCATDDGTTLCDADGEDYPSCDETPDPYRCTAVEDCPGHDTLGATCGPTMRQWQFRVCPSADLIPRCVKLDCFNQPCAQVPQWWKTSMCTPFPDDLIKAYYEPNPCTDPAGLPARIYPGVMAAECVLRSLLPPGEKIKLIRCC